MYESGRDPTCYPGTAVLRNRAGLRSQDDLERFEAAAAGRRFLEPMPVGHFGVHHFKAVHKHIFQDVYAWAGRLRTLRISKGGNVFCYPEHIAAELRRVFADLKQANALCDLSLDDFARSAAHLLAELNAIHAFRDGNGRSQLAFVTLLASHAEHPFDLRRLDAPAFLAAMVQSFGGREGALVEQLGRLATR